MTANLVKNETAEKAAAMLRRIADLIETNEMGVTNMRLIPEQPQKMQMRGGAPEPYRLAIDLDFFILSDRCAEFVSEIRG